MIYIIGIITIILYLIFIVLVIKNKSKRDYKREIIILCITIILMIVSVLKINKIEENQIDYIQNLEEKLNIYRESYEEFCLVDSLRQSDQYE